MAHTSHPSSRRPNRLVHETSPYLQQHAQNPVDWYPWGAEALSAARQLDRPIFLSIGYSACHWCHVMEHESFEDPVIADLMNRLFINIKVDREERPDLDQIYMSAVTAITGRGGWPMSVFLTPNLKPFYGGTYWPPESRMGMPGFRDILERVHEAWADRRVEVEQSADRLTDAVVQMSQTTHDPASLNVDLLKGAEATRLRIADRVHGGFGDAPKFPHPIDLRLLLRTWKRFGNRDALDVIKLTLDKMASGGIYDHLGGGFHRYSTDARWLVPHFEKMLYDNALLTSVFLEAFQATGEPRYADVARETLDYVLREMTDPEGGFCSTQDADSEGEEGKFFVWTEAEVLALLGPEDGRLFCDFYDVSSQGNWEGKNILNRVKTHAQASQLLGITEFDLAAALARSRATLLAHREGRIHPGRDDKTIAAWNGLMIAAMAQGASILCEPRFAAAAGRASDFILQNLLGSDGRLFHGFKDGRAALKAYLDDYAAVIDGLIDAYQATFEVRYVEGAVALAEDMIRRFADEQGGGFFYTSHDHEPLIARNKDLHDNATPSGNGLAAFALLRLGRLCTRADFERAAESALQMLSGEMQAVSMGQGQSLLALDDLLGPAYEMVLVEAATSAETDAALRILHRPFGPNRIIARRPSTNDEPATTNPLAPLLAGKAVAAPGPTLYVCERGTCRAPVTGLPAIGALLQTL